MRCGVAPSLPAMGGLKVLHAAIGRVQKLVAPALPAMGGLNYLHKVRNALISVIASVGGLKGALDS